MNIPFENLQRFISSEQEKYAVHFNDGGTDPKRWSDYFQKMWDNLQNLIPLKRQELRQTVYRLVEDRFNGPKFTRNFLEVLREVFTEYSSQFDQERQKKLLPDERSSANSLQSLLKQIDDHARQMLLMNRKTVIEDDFRGIMNALERLYTCKVEVKARTLSVQLLNALKEEIDQLLIELTAFDRAVETLAVDLQEREQVYAQETGTLTVNGILLYDTKDIEQVFQRAVADEEDAIYQTISQDLLNELGCRLFELHKFDTFRIKDLFNRLLIRAQDEFKATTQVDISTARKFLEHYQTLEQQEAQIKTTFQKSEPFLRFSKEQVGLGWEDLAEKRQKLVGIQGGLKPTDSAVKAVLPILRKVSALDDKNIKPLNDPHRIYFIHETGAFPLRLLEGMEKMRAIYRSVSQSERQNPLHTHLEHRRFHDILPAPQEEVQVKHNLRLAIALGLVTSVENQAKGFSEVRLRYQDKYTGLEKQQSLGANLRESEEFLLSDGNHQLRDILEDSVKSIGHIADSKSDKQALYQRLMTYLKQLEATTQHGKDSPEYNAVEIAIEEYIKTHSLFVGSAPSFAPAISFQPPAASAPNVGNVANASPYSESLERFKKLAQTCYSKGNPTSTELQLLEKFRQKYNIPQELAERLIAEVTPQSAQAQNGVEEYTLMYQAFLTNDGEIDLEEHAQLLELQEELGLSNEQVTTLEANIREESGYSR